MLNEAFQWIGARSAKPASALFLASALAVLTLSPAATSAASSATFAWLPNTEPDLQDYVLSYGGSAGAYTNVTPVGNVTNHTVQGLVEGNTYHFTIVARNTSGLTSDPAPEVIVVVPGITTNRAPSISTVNAQTLAEDTVSAAIPFVVEDADTNAASLLVTAASSNATLLPSSGITLGGTGSNRTVTLRPAANRSGTATVTLSVSDGAATSARSFLVIVTTPADSTLEVWRREQFGDETVADPGAEAGTWGDTADPDGDGRQNLLEFALGLGPLYGEAANAGLSSGVVRLSGKNYLSITFNRRRNDNAVLYFPEVSADNTVWRGGTAVRAVSVTGIDDTFDRATFRDTTAVSSKRPRFIRLRVVKSGS